MRTKPDLVIWPETAFPGFVEEMPQLMEDIRDFARSYRVPVLLGVVAEEGERFYNSGLLISAQGDIADRYDKFHLVPFGEFLPLRQQLPFLADFVPIDDFSSGRKAKVIRLPIKDKEIRFSVAICFEDTLAYIARRFVLSGAELLVNMTNDAWFQDSKEPFMHLQAALFRTIETRRSLVRSANTGVSCHIDPYGRLMGYVQNMQNKRTYVEGTSTFDVSLNATRTIYTKLGDVFTYLCFVCILWSVLTSKRTIVRKV
jgi:apolipoprotein N-acyltransferase